MNFLRSILLLLCMVICSGVFANANKVSAQKVVAPTSESLQTEVRGAYQQVKVTTERVMDIIVQAQAYVEKDPDRFYREVETVLGDVVDFDSFARSVMGKYASSKRYRALKTAEEKTQFKIRMKRFSSVFKNGLVQTYAMGLLAFEGNKIEILPPPKETKNKKGTVTVVQHIYGSTEKPYVVHYKMRRNKADQWKLRNVTIEAINLGKVYQSQFYSAVKQHNGDIDQVIDNWSVTPTEAQEAAG